MDQEIRKIVIFGGGSAGWMTAAYLSKFLNLKNNPKIGITLIESPNIPSVGVGEATVPAIMTFLEDLEFPEAHWLSHCNGTIKLGIKFVNWSGKAKDDVWHYPFDQNTIQLEGYRILEWWVSQYSATGKPPFPINISPADFLMNMKKAPRHLEDPRRFSADIGYAYHFDASLLGEYCKKSAIGNGLQHIQDTVKGVSQNDSGEIDFLHTEKNGKLHGDLFIDCSGFRSELLESTLKEPFISYSDSLLCDHAVVLQIPRKSQDLNSYTTATALSNGWVWEIPLADRISFGYVYSSSFTNKRKAELEFRTFLGKRSDNTTSRHIKMRVGRSKRFWVKNCIAVGLSGGFIEPLESTGLLLAKIGIENILSYFPSKRSDPFLQAEYNRIMAEKYDSTMDFIVLHYCTTSREDSEFWKANKHSLVIPDGVKDRLERWHNGILIRKNEHLLNSNFSGNMFGTHGHERLLTGMHYLPKKTPVSLKFHEGTEIKERIEGFQEHLSHLASQYPSHDDFIKHLNKPQPPTAP
ncbi:MAG: hypothetical protein ACI9S8_000924 [Chlamydiales bacterium]|jgi:hypothetical protein